MQSGMSGESPTAAVASIVRALYGAEPHVTRLPSNNNVVFRVDFADGRASKVVKLAGASETAPASILREQQALAVLARHGIDVPAVEFTQADLPGAGRVFTIMPLLAGTTLEEACKELDPPWAAEACRRAGAFVARMSAVPLAAMPFAHGPREHLAFLARVRGWFAAENMLCPPFSTVLDEVAPLLAAAPRQVIHGDYAWNQIITDGRHFTVIDWESAAVGHPLDMLARAVAMAREYGGRQEHIDWLIEGHDRLRPLCDAERRELHLRELWHHVGCMGWKFVCGPDHRAHAFAMAERVRRWAGP